MEFDEFRSDLIMFHMPEDDDIDEGLVGSVLNLDNPLEIFSHVNFLKGEGNGLFKKGEFNPASEAYLTAIKFLAFAEPRNFEEWTFFFDVGFSLNLNLAMCCLKLHNPLRAEQLCSLVLHHHPENVKGLYRRGVALMELGKYEEAYEDFKEVVKIDPSNREARDKLVQVEGRRSFPRVTKCVGLPDLVLSKKRKKAIDGKEASEQDYGDSFSYGESSHSSIQDVEMVEVTKRNGDDKFALVTCVDSEHSSSVTCAQENITYESKVDSHRKEKEKSLLCFSSRRNKCNTLKISQATYRMVTQGKEVSFSHSHLGGYMTVRVIGQDKNTYNEENTTSEANFEESFVQDSANIINGEPSISDSCNMDGDVCSPAQSVTSLESSGDSCAQVASLVVGSSCGELQTTMNCNREEVTSSITSVSTRRDMDTMAHGPSDCVTHTSPHLFSFSAQGLVHSAYKCKHFQKTPLQRLHSPRIPQAVRGRRFKTPHPSYLLHVNRFRTKRKHKIVRSHPQPIYPTIRRKHRRTWHEFQEIEDQPPRKRLFLDSPSCNNLFEYCDGRASPYR